MYDIVIIGRWTAGLFLAKELFEKNTKIKVGIIGTNYWNSALSPWNIRTSIKAYENYFDLSDENASLKKYFISVYEAKVQEFLKNFNLVKNTFGYRINLKFPGYKILSGIEKLVKTRFDIIKDNVVEIKKHKNYLIKWQKFLVKARKVVIAAWWRRLYQANYWFKV